MLIFQKCRALNKKSNFLGFFDFRKKLNKKMLIFFLQNFKMLQLFCQKELEALLWICFSPRHVFLIFEGKLFFRPFFVIFFSMKKIVFFSTFFEISKIRKSKICDFLCIFWALTFLKLYVFPQIQKHRLRLPLNFPKHLKS